MTAKTILGDTWDSVAYRELGSCRYTPQLINANRQFADVVIFSAGIELKLPDITEERKVTLPPWRTESL